MKMQVQEGNKQGYRCSIKKNSAYFTIFSIITTNKNAETHERYAEIFKASKLKSFEGTEQIQETAQNQKFERIHSLLIIS